MQYVILLSLKGPQLFPQVNFLSIKSRNHWQKLCKFSICCVSTILPSQEVESQIPLPFVLGEKRNMGVHICKCKDHDWLSKVRQSIHNGCYLGRGERGTGVEGGRIIIFTLHILSYLLKVNLIGKQTNSWDKNWSLETILIGALHQKTTKMATWHLGLPAVWQLKSLLDKWWTPCRQGMLKLHLKSFSLY